MIVAVTGGTGFIGRRLVERLLARGDVVRMITRQAAPLEKPALLEICECDLLTAEVGDLAAMLRGVDVLYHCAGQLTDVRTMRSLHVDATRKLIEAASGRIERWVQLSSVGAYGKQREGVVTEQTELRPVGTYEITKVMSDDLVSLASWGGAFEHVILRPSNVYGADMSNQSLFGMINMIQCGRFFFIGKPGASANYIHVDNVVEALILCGTKPEASGQVYDLSDHRTLEQFVAVIAESLGKPAPQPRLPEWAVRLPAKWLGRIPWFPLTESRVDALTGRTIYSTDKIEHELGYRHVVSMEAGLKELVRSWQQRTGA